MCKAVLCLHASQRKSQQWMALQHLRMEQLMLAVPRRRAAVRDRSESGKPDSGGDSPQTACPKQANLDILQPRASSWQCTKLRCRHELRRISHLRIRSQNDPAIMQAHGAMLPAGHQRCLHHVPFRVQPPRLCRAQRASGTVQASTVQASTAEPAARPPWAGTSAENHTDG